MSTAVDSRTVVLGSDTDLDGFKRAARRLLADGVEPDCVQWQVAGDPELFAGEDESPTAASDSSGESRVNVPAAFVTLCREVVLHVDRTRFALLYRLLWRLVHEPALRHDPLDADVVQAQRMAQAVRRDIHKMKAFVRFRPIEDGGAEPLHVAWFEPLHHIVEAAAPFFARRFAQMRWALLTPERSVRWDGHELQFGPGAKREDAPPADAGEQLWLTYYRHIFNPARLKLKMMQKEMPRRYWHNLPEATLISPLAAAAHERSGRMIEAPATEPARSPAMAATRRRAPSAAAALPAGAPTSRAEIPIVAAREDGRPLAEGERAPTLAALGQATQACRECPIGEHATQAVFGEGPLHAPLMLVGEQPGDVEDLRGRPFVGPAGKLLDRALAQLGWQRDSLYLTNAVKHFKYELRGKRRMHKTPAQQEAAACLHWLESEIEVVDPQAIVALGATAARALLGRPVAVMKERGEWLVRADGRRVLVTLHPSALLRAPPETQEDAYRQWLDDLRKATPPAGGTSES